MNEQFYSEEELELLQREGTPIVKEIAGQLAAERREWQKRVDQLTESLRRHKSDNLGHLYGTSRSMLSYALEPGSFMYMARADTIIVLMVASTHEASLLHYWVHVTKRRGGNTSKHEFHTMGNALAFIEKNYS